MPFNCFNCAPDHDQGILAGRDRDLASQISEPLTTYFFNGIHHNNIQEKKIAVSYYNRKLNFLQLHLYSTLIANKLKDRLGQDFKLLNPDEDIVIALCLPPSEKTIVLVFAILKIGAAYMPIDPELPEETLLDILYKFRPIMLITDTAGPILSRYERRNFAQDCILLSLEEVWADVEIPRDKSSQDLWDTSHDKMVTPLDIPDRSTSLIERPAVILVTTSICRDPRGVRISHLAILNRIAWYWRFLPYRKDGSCCLTVPLTFVESVNQIFAPLLKGITLHILNYDEVLDTGVFIKRLGEYKVTRISLSAISLNTFLRECVRMGKDDARTILAYLKFVMCKTQIVPLELLQKFFDIFPSDNKRLCSLYGFPEVSGDIICESFESMKKVKKKLIQGRVLVGEVCDSAQIYILNSTRDLAPDGEQGQICISGIPLALGYVNKKAKQDQAFIVNPYNPSNKYGRIFLTGDYGRLIKCNDNHYRLLIEGRADNFVVHNDHGFVTDDIKDVIMEISTIEHITILVLNEGAPEQAIVAFILPRPDYMRTLTVESVVSQMKNRLPGYMIPIIKIVKDFPMLVTGRLDRHLLVKRYESEKESGFTNWTTINLHNRENLTAAKVLLEGMFKYCHIPIQTAMRSLKSSIYQLGGNSLNTIRLVAYLNEKEFPINVQEFVSARTIEDIINLMENRKMLHSYRHGVASAGHRIQVSKDTGAALLYEIQTLEQRHQREVADLLTKAYTEGGPLFKYNLVTYEDFSKFFQVCWSDIVDQHMSCVVVRKSDYRIVGVAINADFFMEVDSSKASGALKDFVEFNFEVKGQIMGRLEIGDDAVNEIFECILLGTLSGISPGDSVRICMFLMEEMFRLALVDNFKSMYFATANPFMRELLTECYDFKVLDDYIANEYSSDGAYKPFHLAPTTVSICSCYKIVHNLPIPINTNLNDSKPVISADGDG